jgi:hypothetical protein
MLQKINNMIIYERERLNKRIELNELREQTILDEIQKLKLELKQLQIIKKHIELNKI